MNDIIIFDKEVTFIPGCPVRVGDRFFKRPGPGILSPDYIRVIGIKSDPDGGFLIQGKYENRAVGPMERVFHSDLFKDPKWFIQRNNSK